MKTLEQKLAEAQAFVDSIKLQLENKQKFLPKGTICKVWDSIFSGNTNMFRVATGNGTFYYESKNGLSTTWDNFEPLEMGLTFSDNIIHSEDITLEMDKQLALCWDEDEVAHKHIRVIDGITGDTFSPYGARYGYPFGNYQLCTTPVGNLPQWAKDMIDACED
ncbi:MAG: hypothetical protein QG567_1934 [Campylobacterota bacterium]|nr:hypothetical protein [Campylobacterota bacterium]